jgi:hypothetical protein
MVTESTYKEEEYDSQSPSPYVYPTWMYVCWLVLAFIWVVAGIAAFIVSLMCFGKRGPLSHQVIGVILAVLFGPFYWIYFIVDKKYCR